jgi:SAM-dependent methyltransferase
MGGHSASRGVSWWQSVGVDKAVLANRRRWDELARAHYGSAFYDVEGFRRGGSRLRAIELKEIGRVKGRDLLHLQCHFGLDTLSFARLGARVTGVDFSSVAIDLARDLAVELRLDARFVRADVTKLPRSLSSSFDIAYTSRGVLGWIPDLAKWARGIATALRPGGLFYMLEGHPVAATFDDESAAFGIRYPYFPRRSPQRYKVEGSYADRTLRFTQKYDYEWPHALGDVVTALADAGLRIAFIHEFPWAMWEVAPWLVRRGREWYLPKRIKGELPLSFSLAARKAGAAS